MAYFKTIASVSKGGEKYNYLKPYIDLEEILFSGYSTKGKEDLYKEIINFIETNSKNQDLLYRYLLNLLIDFIFIHSQQKYIASFIVAQLYSNFKNKRSFFTNIISKNSHYQKTYVVHFSLLGIVDNSQLLCFQEKNDTVTSFLKENNLSFILKEDDLIKLKEYMNSSNTISKDSGLRIDDKSPLMEVIRTKQENAIFQLNGFNLLDFCAFYGSVKCFQFLKMNGFDYGKYIKEMSIAGGNLEIIHEVEQSEISFNFCFEYSVKYHHQMISEWLLSNYKCEIIPLEECVKYHDFKTFLFFLLNKLAEKKNMAS